MWAVVAALACVLAALPLSIVRQIYAGYQKSYVGNLFTSFGAVLTLTALYAVIRTKGDMPSLILAFAIPPVIIALINLVYLTRKEMPWLTPRFHYISKSALRRLSSTSTPLFLFQIGALLVNETQMIVLAHVTGLKLVSEYSILWRLSVTCASLVALGTGAFIPAFREAHERGDVSWVKSSFRRMLALRMAFATLAGLLLVGGGNLILRLWLRQSGFHFPRSVWLAEAVFLVSSLWVVSFSELMTIMDRIWIQVLMVLINGVTTIVLTILLAPRFGLLGAVIAIAFVTLCFWTWILPLLVRPILSGALVGSRPANAIGSVKI
jgi:O-antigen/teichoic acid export membrane protein